MGKCLQKVPSSKLAKRGNKNGKHDLNRLTTVPKDSQCFFFVFRETLLTQSNKHIYSNKDNNKEMK